MPYPKGVVSLEKLNNSVGDFLDGTDDDVKFLLWLICYLTSGSQKLSNRAPELFSFVNDKKIPLTKKHFEIECNSTKRFALREDIRSFFEESTFDSFNFDKTAFQFGLTTGDGSVEGSKYIERIQKLRSTPLGYNPIKGIFCATASTLDRTIIEHLNNFIDKYGDDNWSLGSPYVIEIIKNLKNGKYDSTPKTNSTGRYVQKERRAGFLDNKLPDEASNSHPSNPKCDLLKTLVTLPNYIEYKSEGEIDLSPRYHGSTLHGREDEIAYLNDFLAHDAPFRMLFVVAPSGAGKTRLATQWFHEHIENTDWQAGFVEEIEDKKVELIGKWRDWKDLEKHPITCDTVIIIDYIYRFKDIVRAVIDKGKQLNKTKTSDNTSAKTQPSKTFPRLRLIILDHIYDETQLTTYQEDALGKDNETIAHSQTINHPPLYLETSDEDLKKIIVDASKLSSDSPLIDQAFETLMQMDDATELATSGDKGRYSRQPLFALMIGMAIADANAEDRENITQWKRSELIEAYLDRTNRIPWDKSTGNDWESGTIVAAATALQGLKYSAIFRQHFSVLGTEKDRIISDCQYIVSDNDPRFLKKYEPDIVGESFVLLFFKQFGSATDHPAKSTFFKLLNHQGNVDQNDLVSFKLSDRFIEFIQRTARNIINDKAGHHDLDILADLLNPDHYRDSNIMQLSANVAVVHVIKQIKEKSGDELHLYFDNFINFVDFSFLCKWFKELYLSSYIVRGTGSVWSEILSAITHYVDTLIEGNFFDGDIEEQYESCIVCYEKYSKSNRTRFFIPASFGAVNVLRFLMEKGEEQLIDKTDDQKKTPFLLSCELGFYNISSELIKYKVNLNATGINGRNPLYYCIRDEQLEFTKIILDGTKNEDDIKNGSNLLHVCCLTNNINIFSLFISYEFIDVNGYIDSYRHLTALSFSIWSGNLNVVPLLINHPKINLNKPNRNEDRFTPLHCACVLGYESIVMDLLAKAELEVNALDGAGRTQGNRMSAH